MNILLINTLDTVGGAAIQTWELRQELKRRGHTVNMIVGYKKSNETDVFVMPRYPGQARLSRWFADDIHFAPSDRLLNMPIFKTADIIHCHNLHSSFFNLTTLNKITALKKPVLWTQHDLWAITSGETTTKALRMNKPNRFLGRFWDNRPHLLKMKRAIYQSSPFWVSAPSEWLLRRIKTSSLRDHKSFLIRNGVNTNVFKQADKQQIRRDLKLPVDKKIIMFAANSGMNNRLKGSNYVTTIMESFASDPRILFLSVGNKTETLHSNHLAIGYLDNRETLASYYQAADLLLYPSLSDNCPLVVLESMACGTPVVTFDTDGIPEIIGDKSNGYIAEYENVSDLKNGVGHILSLPKDQYQQMCNSCSKRIKQLYSLEVMVDQFECLYEMLRGTPPDTKSYPKPWG